MIKIDFDTYLNWILTDPSILSNDIEIYWVDLTKLLLIDNYQYTSNDCYYYQYNNHIILIQYNQFNMTFYICDNNYNILYEIGTFNCNDENHPHIVTIYNLIK